MANDTRFKLTLAEAQAQHRCRVCGQSTTAGPFPIILCYGEEHSHQQCLERIGLDWKREYEKRTQEKSPEFKSRDTARLDWLERSTHVAAEVRALAEFELGRIQRKMFREQIDGLMEKEGRTDG